MLVHICCSVDSHYFLTRLKADYPNEKIVGYFYNPNIHPKEEYDLRLLDVKRSCKALDIELLEGIYDDDLWFRLTQKLEEAPEKGVRCEVCFDMRFLNSAFKAKELGIKRFTSTLLQSPLKDRYAVIKSAAHVKALLDIDFIAVDYRSQGGMNEQNKTAKNAKLYRQNYCGCIYALIAQRQKQNKPAYELFNPLPNKQMPCSANNRQEIFETKGSNICGSILNYRLLRAYIKSNNEIIDSVCLAYSKASAKSWSDTPTMTTKDAMLFEKHSAKIITLEKYNNLAGTKFETLRELCSSGFLNDIVVKSKLSGIEALDISPVFVTIGLPSRVDIEFYLESEIFQDKEFMRSDLPTA